MNSWDERVSAAVLSRKGLFLPLCGASFGLRLVDWTIGWSPCGRAEYAGLERVSAVHAMREHDSSDTILVMPFAATGTRQRCNNTVQASVLVHGRAAYGAIHFYHSTMILLFWSLADVHRRIWCINGQLLLAMCC